MPEKMNSSSVNDILKIEKFFFNLDFVERYFSLGFEIAHLIFFLCNSIRAAADSMLSHVNLHQSQSIKKTKTRKISSLSIVSICLLRFSRRLLLLLPSGAANKTLIDFEHKNSSSLNCLIWIRTISPLRFGSSLRLRWQKMVRKRKNEFPLFSYHFLAEMWWAAKEKLSFFSDSEMRKKEKEFEMRPRKWKRMEMAECALFLSAALSY